MFNRGYSAYGYDQLFVDVENYGDIGYNSSMIGQKPRQPEYQHQTPENMYAQQAGLYQMPPKPPRKPTNYGNVYDYLEKNVRDSYNKKNSKDDDIEELKKKLADFQQKHDFLLLFIICIIVYVLINFGSRVFTSLEAKQNIQYVYYNPNDMPTMGIPVAGMMPTMGGMPATAVPIIPMPTS